MWDPCIDECAVTPLTCVLFLFLRSAVATSRPSFNSLAFRSRYLQSFSILVASVLVQGGIATNAVDRHLRYNQRRSWLPIIVFCTKNMGYFLVVRSP